MTIKPAIWIGSSGRDIKEFPKDVRRLFGYALWQIQQGRQPSRAKVKALRGFQGAGVLEMIASKVEGTYRFVYTVRFAKVVYVLHVFQKKSKHGIKTPPQDINLIRKRLKLAEDDYAKRHATKD